MRPDVIRFEGFEYRRGERCLCFGDRRLAVGSRALALLDALLSRPGDYLSAVELMRAAWPDTYVDESNLRVQISALRRHFEPCGRSIVQNAPGRGYAFVGRIDQAEPHHHDIVLVFSLSSGKLDLHGAQPDQLAPALRAVLERIEPAVGTEQTDLAGGGGGKC